MTARRVLLALFVAYVAATAVHIGWIMAHEPFSFDAWNVAVDTHARPFSISRFFAYWRYEYVHSNPRIGQAFTYFAYKLEYFAIIATPLAFLALSLAVTVLGTARWPRRVRDLALWTISTGFLWFAAPQLGKTMFCRAYGANYLYGAAIQLWFLVPLRLVPSGQARTGACIAYFVAGVVAGLCNEHTGPTLCLAMVAITWWRWRQVREAPRLFAAGAAGVIVGFAAIFFAPGQGERYEGLAQHVSLFGRLAQRAITGNLDIYRGLVIAAAPLLGLFAIALVIARRDPDDDRRDALAGPLRFVGIALIAASLVTATLFVSPKLGPRFFLAPMALLLAGFVGVADAVLTSPRRLVPFVALAVAASTYACTRTIRLYGRVAVESRDRLAALEASKPGTYFTVNGFEQVEDSWWFLGDDFRDIRKRQLVADYFGLAGVIVRGYDPDAPLGVSDVHLVPRYTLSPASCLDEHGGFQLGTYRGLDVGSIQKAMLLSIDQLQRKLGDTHLDHLDLVVEFEGDRPALPAPTILVGKWRPDHFEAWAGKVVRVGSSHQDDILLPKGFPAGYEMWIYQVGGKLQKLGTSGQAQPLRYSPWRPGPYWALACRDAECFVVVATHHGK